MKRGLDELLARSTVYAILFRNAGVGIQFYNAQHHTDDWRRNLCVHNYYPTLSKAIQAEHERLDGIGVA